MTQQKTGQRSETAGRETPKFLWRSGELVEWDKATVHISALGWTAISSVFEGIRAYRFGLTVQQTTDFIPNAFKSPLL